MALPVKLAICADHFSCDPGACFVIARDSGAMNDYLWKRAIDSEVELVPGSGKTPGNVQLVKFENAPFLGATPWKYFVVDGPWKNPAAVSAQKVCGSEWST